MLQEFSYNNDNLNVNSNFYAKNCSKHFLLMNYSILTKTISIRDYFYSHFTETGTKQLFQGHQLSNKEDSIQKSGKHILCY